MKKIFFFLLIVLVLSPFFVFAQAKTYTPLINDLPGTTEGQPVNLTTYLGGLYRLLIGLTIALAFIVITFEGLKHMGSESPFAKSEASRRIGEAIGGIILAVMSWLILFTINPNLVSFQFLKTAEKAASNVPKPGIQIVSTTIPASQNTPIAGSVRITGGTGQTTYSIVSGFLPDGVTINPNTGELSGEPKETGDFVFTVKVTDSSGNTNQKQVTLSVTGSTLLTIQGGDFQAGGWITGSEYRNQITPTGGKPPYSFRLTNGTMPNGWNLSSSGLISGTTNQIGDFQFTVQVDDSSGLSRDVFFNIGISAPQTNPISFCYRYKFTNTSTTIFPICAKTIEECLLKQQAQEGIITTPCEQRVTN